MTKKEIFLKNIGDFPKGYGTFDSPQEHEIWEAIQENTPDSHRYLKHFVAEDWKATPEVPDYEVRIPTVPDIDIPMGIKTYTLILYTEPAEVDSLEVNSN